MSLTSYRAAPPRVTIGVVAYGKRFFPVMAAWRRFEEVSCVWQTWRRPTLPRLETKYHRRWGVSRPCSAWERVQPPRHNHQVGQTHDFREAGFVPCRVGAPEPQVPQGRPASLLSGRSPSARLRAAGRPAPSRSIGPQGRSCVSAKRWARAMRMIKPIELLVPVSFMRCRTSTPGLSTWSSTTALREHSFSGGFPA